MKKLAITWKSAVIFVSITSLAFFLLFINFIPQLVFDKGLTKEFRGIHIWPDKRIYVNQSNPDMNYIDSWEIIIGNSCQSYLHYSLERLPEETEELFFFIYTYEFYMNDIPINPPVEYFEINLIITENNWNSSEITWNNKPKHEEVIDTMNVSDIYTNIFYGLNSYNLNDAINLTNIYKNDQLNGLSLCINITENNEELDADIHFYSIGLIWRFDRYLISYTAIISSITIFFMLIGIIIFLNRDINTCQNCGTKRKFTKINCPSCQLEIDKDSLIKARDYEVLLMGFWTFIFFESSSLIIIYVLNINYFGVGIIGWEWEIILPLIVFGIIYYKLIRKELFRFINLRKQISMISNQKKSIN